MVKFTHYLIYGYPDGDDFREKMDAWAKTAEKMNMKMVKWGVSIGTSEDILVIVKGDITDFEKLYSAEHGPPIRDRRTTFLGDWS